jgi:rhodanese-related sulfurtransferase
MSVQQLISEGATVVDVRSRGEFAGGHVADSINIPLNEVVERIEDLKNLQQPFVLCCMSGARSGQAAAYLNAQGIKCENGGGWMEVNFASQNIKKYG